MNSAQNSILAVDTSSRRLSVAISHGEDLYEVNLDGTPRHSGHLIGLIEQGLRSLGLKKNEITHFLWGLGPGSFTGLRIGFAVLKGLHIGLGKRAFGASSLDLIALGSGIVNGELMVCVDARRQRIYTATYIFKDGNAKRILQNSLFSLDELMKKVKPGMTLTGDALSVYGEAILEKHKGKISFLDTSFWYPRARCLIRLFEDYREWLKPLSLRTMVPYYLRSSEAEENYKKKSKKQ
jgi:tRNA threonylcarbamoyladenosine biosynthesis protein TsaB